VDGARPPDYLEAVQTTATLTERLEKLDWPLVSAALERGPFAALPGVLSRDECEDLAALYDGGAAFRSRVVMERHRFGAGEYQYFADPLPPLVAELREQLYPPLAAVANEWMEALGSAERFPASLPEFRRFCAAQGQSEPTPLLLRYEAGGYNCLHQDVYGAVAFPLQVVAFLSRPGLDFTGGEFLLVEQRPRAQSVGTVVTGGQGDLVVFPNRFRPVAGTRGVYRTTVRHGLSRVWSGRRHALGLIFHDAR
jgi:uncharacterized protein